MTSPPDLELTVNGGAVRVPDEGSSLLEVLRDRLGIRSPKDGCSPQGQCGCCTVLVDGKPRVACVTPARRVRGRDVVTVEGLTDADRRRWGAAFTSAGASQCGFCTPGIILRLHAHGVEAAARDDDGDLSVRRALLPHLCRCTGWNTIVDAYRLAAQPVTEPSSPGRADGMGGRDRGRAERRAAIEGGTGQRVGAGVALGAGGFADDAAPLDALVAVRAADGTYMVGESVSEARAAAGKIQGRRTTFDVRHPLSFPDGAWSARLRTTWVEPAYLETDAAWCLPGGEPASPLANGGAFGGKASSPVAAVARRLADEHGRPVRVLWSREDTVRLGPKRPPIAAGARADGTGVVRAVRTPGIADAIHRFAPGLEVEEVDVPGPPTSTALRAAGWAEVAALLASARGAGPVRSPSGAVAEARVEPGVVRVAVACGDPLDDVVLRSYCIGAAHMALSWVWSEGLAVDETGEVHDLTIRSFGILRAVDMPEVEVEIERSVAEPVNGSDAVFAAVAAAAAVAEGCPEEWPCRRSRSDGGPSAHVDLQRDPSREERA